MINKDIIVQKFNNILDKKLDNAGVEAFTQKILKTKSELLFNILTQEVIFQEAIQKPRGEKSQDIFTKIYTQPYSGNSIIITQAGKYTLDNWGYTKFSQDCEQGVVEINYYKTTLFGALIKSANSDILNIVSKILDSYPEKNFNIACKCGIYPFKFILEGDSNLYRDIAIKMIQGGKIDLNLNGYNVVREIDIISFGVQTLFDLLLSKKDNYIISAMIDAKYDFNKLFKTNIGCNHSKVTALMGAVVHNNMQAIKMLIDNAYVDVSQQIEHYFTDIIINNLIKNLEYINAPLKHNISYQHSNSGLTSERINDCIKSRKEILKYFQVLIDMMSSLEKSNAQHNWGKEKQSLRDIKESFDQENINGYSNRTNINKAIEFYNNTISNLKKIGDNIRKFSHKSYQTALSYAINDFEITEYLINQGAQYTNYFAARNTNTTFVSGDNFRGEEAQIALCRHQEKIKSLIKERVKVESVIKEVEKVLSNPSNVTPINYITDPSSFVSISNSNITPVDYITAPGSFVSIFDPVSPDLNSEFSISSMSSSGSSGSSSSDSIICDQESNKKDLDDLILEYFRATNKRKIEKQAIIDEIAELCQQDISTELQLISLLKNGKYSDDIANDLVLQVVSDPKLIHKYFSQRKKILQEELENALKEGGYNKSPTYDTKWLVNGELITDSKVKLVKTKMKCSKLYVTSNNPEIYKIISGIDDLSIIQSKSGGKSKLPGHSGVKFRKDKGLYVLKSKLKDHGDIRYVSNKVYKNESGDLLVIFNKCMNHKEINALKKGKIIFVDAWESQCADSMCHYDSKLDQATEEIVIAGGDTTDEL